jgi:AraC-like DNA-binding protein
MHSSCKLNTGKADRAHSVSDPDGLPLLTEPACGEPATYGGMQNAVMSMRVVRGLVEAVEQAGVSRVDLLRAAELDATQLDSEEACVPRSMIYRVCEAALDLTGDPAFGLHWSERLHGSAFNPVSHLVAHAPTLRQGFESLSRFHRLLSDHPTFRLSEEADKVKVDCFNLIGASPRMQRLASEMLVSGVIRLIRSFSAQARVDSVAFEYPMPDYHSEYTRCFGLTPSFGQPHTCIVFDRALMNATSLHKDEDVHDALRAIAERRILRLTQHTTFTSRVRDLLVEQLCAHQADMTRVARAFGLSRRSLRRRLEAEGSSYRAIVKEALAIVAKQYLRDKRLTIQETAYEMGFADPTTFHRAFKRWTGKTPSAYREMPLEQPVMRVQSTCGDGAEAAHG